MEASSFADRIRVVLDELGREPLPWAHLAPAAARLDQLGRRLHGLGLARDHEIGGCLTAAVRELGRARGLPESDRAESVRRAVREVARALALAVEGAGSGAEGPGDGTRSEGKERAHDRRH
jgi:hypothetical protein